MVSSLSRGLRRAVQALSIVMLTAGLSEIAFRVLHYVHPIFIFPEASYDRFRAQPGVDVYGTPINSRGFKDVEHPVEKTAGVYRILGVGDSFVYGVVPYEDNFLTLLENELKDRHETPIEIVKMGIPRIGVNDYFALLAREGMQLEPDLVLLCFFIGNDFVIENLPETRRSHLWAFLRFLFYVLPDVEGNVYKNDHYDDDASTFGAEGYLRIQAPKLDVFARDGAWLDPRLDGALIYLERIAKLCRYGGADLLVVLVPDELQVDPETRRATLAASGRSTEDLDFERPNHRLTQALEKRGIATLDLLPALVAAGREKPVYKPRDTHWNQRGNRIAATALGEHLTGSGRLPP